MKALYAILVASLTLGAVVFAPITATADGMAFVYDTGTSLAPLAVDEQRAVIAHKDSVQKMFIAINLGDALSSATASRKAVWIFPVPGGPERAHVDVTDFFPHLVGKNVERAFEEAVVATSLLPLVTQPHFIPLPFFLGTRFFGAGVVLRGVEGAPPVTVHKEIDRWGLHSELITASSAKSVAEHLRAKGVKVDEKRLNSFEPYLSDKYALVVTWISSREKVVKKFPENTKKMGASWPTLYVEFPTERPFYPMRPTSGYGKDRVSVTLHVIGWKSLDSSPRNPAGDARVSVRSKYFVGDLKGFEKGYRSFLSKREKKTKAGNSHSASSERMNSLERFLAAIPEGEIHFTRTSVSAPANAYTEDFWFSTDYWAPIMYWFSSPWIFIPCGILALAGLSYLSGAISGRIVFREWRRWGRIGLWNCLTVVALFASAWVVRGRSTLEQRSDSGGSGRWDAFVFGALASIPFAILLCSLPKIFSRSNIGFAEFGIACLSIGIELVIAGFIVSRPPSVQSSDGLRCPTNKPAPVPQGIKESFIRIALMCAPSVAVMTWDISQLLVQNRIPGFPLELLCIITGIGVAIAFTAAACILLLSRASKKRPSDLDQSKPRLIRRTALAIHRNSATLIMAALTLIVAVLTMVSLPGFSGADSPGEVCRFVSYGVIAGLSLITTLIVKKRASLPGELSDSSRFGGPYRGSLAALCIVFGTLTYFGVLAQFVVLHGGAGAIRDCAVILALLSAAWLIKGELHDRPTKALRFGALFSIVFTILTLSAFWTIQVVFPGLW